MEFYDLNQAVAHYGKKLLESNPIVSTNDKNSERYKKQLGGEITQEFFKIKNSRAVIPSWNNHKGFEWWTYGEILSEMLNLDPPIMYKYKPELFSQHYDLLEDGRMQYTYSNRFVEFSQFVNLHRRLKENPNSKRGVVTIYTPYDTSPERLDAPCTTQYHFLQRDGKLNMSVFFRSWDLFGGVKYDPALTSFIQQSVSSWCGFEPGTLGIYANSLHFYERDRETLERLVEESKDYKPSKELIVDGNLGIKEFYDGLRGVKAVEEAAYNGNFARAEELKNGLPIELFKRMGEIWIKKNEKTPSS